MSEPGVGETDLVRTTTDLPAADPADPGDPGDPVPAVAAPPVKRKRGLESLSDMVRSLGVVMIIVFGIWFFAQAPASDKKTERDINPAVDVRSFTGVVPMALVPAPSLLPSGWRATVSAYESEPNRLRIGYLTAANHYAEYAAVSGPGASYVADLTDRGTPVRRVDIAGQPWELVQDSAGRQSLVRAEGTLTVIVGTLRNNATLDELTALAGGLRKLG